MISSCFGPLRDLTTSYGTLRQLMIPYDTLWQPTYNTLWHLTAPCDNISPDPIKGSESRVELEVTPVVPHLTTKVSFLKVRGGRFECHLPGGALPPQTPEIPWGHTAPQTSP